LETSTLQATPEEYVHERVERYLDGGDASSFLISAAPGMGKTSFLEASVRNVRRPDRVVFVSGSVVASEGHFVQVLQASAKRPSIDRRDWRSGLRAFLTQHGKERLVLAIDDFDQLAYKRDELARVLADALSSPDPTLFLLTGARSTVDRIVGSGRPFANLLTTVTIEPLDEAAAERLIRLRAPGLTNASRSFVVRETGGHPGAIVFLSRVVESTLVGSEFDERKALSLATELAGAVYAEPWSVLGPQQRAILWHLSSAGKNSSVTDIAHDLVLQPSHVSAQLARLVEEGLIRRDGRGSYAIAPLLARWIVTRGVRAALAAHASNQFGPRPFGAF
jgi:DNA-binding transcriptional ArsR family regulator